MTISSSAVIAIDASRAFVHERTGIEEYAYEVVKHLREPLRERRVVLYVRFGGEAAKHPRTWIETQFFSLPDSWSVRVVRPRRLWTQWGLAYHMWRDAPDVLFVPAHTVPWKHPRNTVVVVHGLEYEMTPQAYSRYARLYMRWSIRASCRWARHIITVSDNTARDVHRLYGVPRDRMTTVYEGVNKPLDAEADDTSLCPDNPYFFFVGRLEERKNIVRIVQAFDRFKDIHKTSHVLVLAGGRGYGAEAIDAAIDAANHQKDIIRPGFISDAQKWALLRGAQAFVFPTLYEGFGLPVLEAQSVHVPVITSTVSSLPEVVTAPSDPEPSALLVDPYDVEEIAEAMAHIAQDASLRRAIIDRGVRNCARFDWATCAQEIARVLDY